MMLSMVSANFPAGVAWKAKIQVASKSVDFFMELLCYRKPARMGYHSKPRRTDPNSDLHPGTNSNNSANPSEDRRAAESHPRIARDLNRYMPNHPQVRQSRVLEEQSRPLEQPADRWTPDAVQE